MCKYQRISDCTTRRSYFQSKLSSRTAGFPSLSAGTTVIVDNARVVMLLLRCSCLQHRRVPIKHDVHHICVAEDYQPGLRRYCPIAQLPRGIHICLRMKLCPLVTSIVSRRVTMRERTSNVQDIMSYFCHPLLHRAERSIRFTHCYV